MLILRCDICKQRETTVAATEAPGWAFVEATDGNYRHVCPDLRCRRKAQKAIELGRGREVHGDVLMTGAL